MMLNYTYSPYIWSLFCAKNTPLVFSPPTVSIQFLQPSVFSPTRHCSVFVRHQFCLVQPSAFRQLILCQKYSSVFSHPTVSIQFSLAISFQSRLSFDRHCSVFSFQFNLQLSGSYLLIILLSFQFKCHKYQLPQFSVPPLI